MRDHIEMAIGAFTPAEWDVKIERNFRHTNHPIGVLG
jgi:hypothetical protein